MTVMAPTRMDDRVGSMTIQCYCMTLCLTLATVQAAGSVKARINVVDRVAKEWPTNWLSHDDQFNYRQLIKVIYELHAMLSKCRSIYLHHAASCMLCTYRLVQPHNIIKQLHRQYREIYFLIALYFTSWNCLVKLHVCTHTHTHTHIYIYIYNKLKKLIYIYIYIYIFINRLWIIGYEYNFI